MARVPTEKVCTECRELKRVEKDFQKNSSPLYKKDGHVNICKKCVINMSWNLDLEKEIMPLLQIFDKPYIPHIFEGIKDVEPPEKVFTKYLIRMNMRQYKDLRFYDSKKFDGTEIVTTIDDIDDVKEEVSDIHDGIKVDRETVEKWGTGFSKEEYINLEKFYDEMMTSNEISTPQHRQLLKQLCKLNIHMDRCLSEGNFGDYSKLGTQYEKIIDSSGWKPKDSVSKDEAVGVRSFSQIFEEVEKDGFIKPAPIEENKDIVDITLMAYINHVRKLLEVSKLDKLPSDVEEEVFGDDYE